MRDQIIACCCGLTVAWLVAVPSAVQYDAPKREAVASMAIAPYFVRSTNRHYFFKMCPGADDGGFGFAYRATNEKENQVLWTTKGWYSDHVFMHGGQYLARLDWVKGDPTELTGSEKARVSFYLGGRLLLSHSLAEFARAGEDPIVGELNRYTLEFGYLCPGTDPSEFSQLRPLDIAPIECCRIEILGHSTILFRLDTGEVLAQFPATQ